MLPVGFLKLGFEDTENPADFTSCSFKSYLHLVSFEYVKSRPVSTSTFLPYTVEPIIFVSRFALSCANLTALILLAHKFLDEYLHFGASYDRLH